MVPDDFIVEIDKWETPATHYPEKEVGSARVVHGYYKKGFYHNYGLRGYQYFRVAKQIPVTELQIKDNGEWNTWMVDDPPHLWSMEDYARDSMGRVLTTGLGLGLVIHPLMNNVDVNSITVVEVNKDVIDLISPLLSKDEDVDFKIVNQDFYDFITETDEDFDRIIVDLWTSGSREETLKLLVVEVLPLSRVLEEKFPNASFVFHGFDLSYGPSNR